jgi:hypothetical protein
MTARDRSIARLRERGWSAADVRALHDALAGQSAAVRDAATLADLLSEHVPGISVAETARWIAFFHTPTVRFPTPVLVLRYWLDRAGPDPAPRDVLPAAAYVEAAGGDHELARTALSAGLSAGELAAHVAAGTADRESLAVLAVLAGV